MIFWVFRETVQSVCLCYYETLGFNLPNYNVITMSLARTYWGIPSSSYEIGGNTTLTRRLKNWGAIRTSGLRPSVHIPNLQPPGFRMVLPCLRTQTVFPNTSSPDSQYSPNTYPYTLKHLQGVPPTYYPIRTPRP